jgi:KRAB domain-containing zinc finger protein
MKFKHLRVKPHHLCQVCGKEFKETSGLKQHERSHLPDEEKLIHQCTHCGKRFSQKPTLRAHLKLHTAEKTIICHICSKAFTTQNYLKVHLATHEIENIACNFCDGIFKNKSSLQSHVRKMHKPGNSAYPCLECGKCFPNRNFLKRHMVRNLIKSKKYLIKILK